MSFFVVKLESCDEIVHYFRDVNERNSQAMLEVKTKLLFREEGEVLWLNLTRISIPPFYWFGVLAFFLYAFFGFWLWFVLGIFFGLCSIPFLKFFHIWAFKRGLKKAGYKGSVVLFSSDLGIEEVLFK